MITQSARSRVRQQCLMLAAAYGVLALVLGTPVATSQEGARGNVRADLRKDPLYAQLIRDGKAFLALPTEKQDAMRKLLEDLEKLAPAERDWLKEVLKRYSDWLEKLPDSQQREIVQAKDLQARLNIIQELRENEWLQHQPRAVKEMIEKTPKSKPTITALAAASAVGMLAPALREPGALATGLRFAAEPGENRAEKIKRLKQEETRKSREWLVAKRHWTDLFDNPKTKSKPTMPTHAAEFDSSKKDPVVATFVKDFLRPVLSREEQNRLDRAEGQWPGFPLMLVELADKHPLALPQSTGPEHFNELPAKVQEEARKALATVPGGKKGDKKVDKKGGIIKTPPSPEKYFLSPEMQAKAEKRLVAAGLPNPTPAQKFAWAIADTIHEAGGNLPHELWPAKPGDMSPPMQAFLDEKGPFWLRLSPDERQQLTAAQKKWPDYPLKIQELATKYGFRPPWQTLPIVGNKLDMWDRYRVKPYNKVELVPQFNQKREAVAVDLLPKWFQDGDPGRNGTRVQTPADVPP